MTNAGHPVQQKSENSRGSWLEKEEYITLRKEIENCISTIQASEKTCILVIAAIATWASSQKENTQIIKIVRYIPLFIIFFNALICFALHNHMKIVSTYIKHIETKNNDNNCFVGWEHYFNAKRRCLQTIFRYAYWIILTISTLLYAFFYTPNVRALTPLLLKSH